VKKWIFGEMKGVSPKGMTSEIESWSRFCIYCGIGFSVFCG